MSNELSEDDSCTVSRRTSSSSQNMYMAEKFTGALTVPLSETIEAFAHCRSATTTMFRSRPFYNCGGIDDLERNAHELAGRSLSIG